MWFGQIYVVKLQGILEERFNELVNVETKNQKKKRDYGILQAEEEKEYDDLLVKYNEFKE